MFSKSNESLIRRIFMKFLLLYVLLYFMAPASSFAEEQILLKQRITRKSIVAGPTSFLAQTTGDKDLMPGNNEFGFLFKPSDDKNGVCRLRSKLLCDYGMENLKEIKNLQVHIKLKAGVYNQATDHSGVLDMLFRCPATWQQESIRLSAGKYTSTFVLKDAPPTHRIPDKQCK